MPHGTTRSNFLFRMIGTPYSRNMAQAQQKPSANQTCFDCQLSASQTYFPQTSAPSSTDLRQKFGGCPAKTLPAVRYLSMRMQAKSNGKRRRRTDPTDLRYREPRHLLGIKHFAFYAKKWVLDKRTHPRKAAEQSLLNTVRLSVPILVFGHLLYAIAAESQCAAESDARRIDGLAGARLDAHVRISAHVACQV